jgi:very-short-patch-repair endonuclease
MSRRPRVPPQLPHRPFSLAEARAAGLTSTALEGKTWRRLGSKLYCWSGLDEDPWEVLVAWRGLLPAYAVFAGATAAWMAGLDFSPTDPVEIVVPSNSGLRSRPGLSVRRCRILPGDVVTIRRLRATCLPRTFHHLSLRLPAVEILVAMDAALRKKLAPAKAFRGRKLQRLAAMAAPAESPMETRLRWLLIQRGLPRPEVQVKLGDEKNGIGRADLYYPSARLILEYDGGKHRDRWSKTIAARIDCSAPGSGCCVSQPATSTTSRMSWRRWCEAP